MIRAWMVDIDDQYLFGGTRERVGVCKFST